MINLIISGVNGRMGQVVAKLASGDNNFNIVCGFDIYTELVNKFEVFKLPNEYSGSADMVIDFSHPSMLEPLLDYCLRRKLPVVVATTGHTASQIDMLHNASAMIPIFSSANMSLGVSLIIDLACKAAKLLGSGFDIEIIEKHHNLKIDAPSGTALAIADAIASSVAFDAQYSYDRHSVRKKRNKNEIGIHSVRGGTIVGEHEIIFAGNDEIIEIKHTATSKEIFAVGALKAAEYLVNKTPGLYNMNDLVRLITN